MSIREKLYNATVEHIQSVRDRMMELCETAAKNGKFEVLVCFSEDDVAGFCEYAELDYENMGDGMFLVKWK